MAKYRIKQKGGYYYPQRRFMFIWLYMYKRDWGVVECPVIGQAKRYLDHKAVKPKVKYYPYP